MNRAQRCDQKELLDGDDIPFGDLAQNLRELDIINTRLGGHRITLQGLKALLPEKDFPEILHVAEIGCGGGDNLRVIARFLQEKNIPFHLTGIDLKPECIQYAQAHSGIPPQSVSWVCSDYESVDFGEAGKPHIIFSSLFCHHFPNEALVTQMQWLAQNSRLGFFINDLHRHPLAYQSIKILTRLFSKSYLVKNDAPLSVLRAFRRADWIEIFRKSGLPQPRIQWQWAFRYLVIWGKAPHAENPTCQVSKT